MSRFQTVFVIYLQNLTLLAHTHYGLLL